MKNNENLKDFFELTAEQLDGISGGLIVEEENENKCWLVRENGTIISPVPDRTKAAEFAKAYGLSTRVLTKEEYQKRFGRELKW